MHYVYTNQKPLSRIPDSQIRQKLIRKPQHPSKSLSTSLSIQIRIIPSRSIHVRFLIFHNHFRSKLNPKFHIQVKQNIRIVPVHDRSKSCDLESLYQLIAHDVNQNTNMMVFSTFSDDIDAIVYNHNVAGLAQNLDITISFYYQKVSFCHILPRFCYEMVRKISCEGNINLFGQIRTGNNLI